MIKRRILIVEDSEPMQEALLESLRDDYFVEAVESADSAIKRLDVQNYDLVILDVGLPIVDGYKLCTMIRHHSKAKNVAIIMLSGRGQVEDKLVGFNVGADDYLAKPGDLRELRARINLQLRKRSQIRTEHQLRAGPFQCDAILQRISMEFDGKIQELDLSQLEFRLMHYFLTHMDHVLSRKKLIDEVWGTSRQVSPRSVDTAASKLRQKLGPWGELLQSVHGVGYRFCSPEKLDQSA